MSGFKQRVGLAQAILGFPEIIILDEPTVGLDPKQIIEIRELIRHLGEKHTVILSSHILPEISAVCDHVFIISKGKLVASDSTENLVNLMSGAQEIELPVRTGAGEAAGYLQGEENIARVEQADHDKIRIYAKKGADVREEVFRQMAEHNIPVLEMKTVTKMYSLRLPRKEVHSNVCRIEKRIPVILPECGRLAVCGRPYGTVRSVFLCV